MLSTRSKNQKLLVAVLCLFIAYILLVPALKRGLFFREDYLPFFTKASLLFVVVGLVAAFRDEPLWHGDVDIPLAVVALLYALTVFWAQSRWAAIDGAMKYAVYLMIFMIARYIAHWDLGDRIIRNLLIMTGLVAAGIGYLHAARLINYSGAIVNGAMLGSFQYPNALAAYSMFVSFLVLGAWAESETSSLWGLASGLVYSAVEFLLFGAIVLSYSRATWIIYGVLLVGYILVLPNGLRVDAVTRFLAGALPMVIINTRLDAAIRAGDFYKVRGLLPLGLALTAAIAAARWLAVRFLGAGQSTVPVGKAESAGTRVAAEKRGGSVRVFAALLIVAVVAAAVIWISGGQALLEKVLPASVVARFKSIRPTDVSLLGRFFATKDALSIALDNPFGAGAGGWKALYHLYQVTPYWFTETHNHFAQVLVETGFPGLLAFLAFWAGILFLLIKAFLKLRSLAEERAAMVNLVSTGMAAISLAIHSALDFDLSLPAISVGLFIGLGALCSEGGPWVTRFSLLPKPRSAPSIQKDKSPKRRSPSLVTSWTMLATILTMFVLASPVAYISSRLFRGMAYGGYGAQTLASGNVNQGRELLLSAMKFDPNYSNYALELAVSYARDYLSTGDSGSKGMAKLYLDLAHRKDPVDPDRQAAEAQILVQIGYLDEGIDAARLLAKMIPTDLQFHELLASYMTMGIVGRTNDMATLSPAQPAFQQHKTILLHYADLADEITNTLAAKKARVTGLYRNTFNPQALEPSPKIALAVGETSFLKGDQVAASKYLSLAATDKALAAEAGRWISALGRATGGQVTLPAGVTPSDKETGMLSPLFGVLRQSP